jgi:hypothetical protein
MLWMFDKKLEKINYFKRKQISLIHDDNYDIIVTDSDST